MKDGVAVPLFLGGYAAVAVLVLLWWRHRMAQIGESLENRLAAGRERVLAGPDHGGYFRGILGNLGMLRSSAVFALTCDHLLVYPLLGPPREVPVGEIAEARVSKWFRGSYGLGRTYLVLRQSDGRQLVFAVRDPAPWLDALEKCHVAISR
ncbi:MAG: hypothetical protein QHJ73_19810 [Armatimonadota bacterium]|jgi:hypothetical protein|nr:hypothetical protein [Armatimonadota bacterium]